MPLKTGRALSRSIAEKMQRQSGGIDQLTGGKIGGCWYHDGPTYWIRALPFEPTGNASDRSSHYHRIPGLEPEHGNVLAAILSSTTFYFHFKLSGNCRDLGSRDIQTFRLPVLATESLNELTSLGGQLGLTLARTAKRCVRSYPSGVIEYDEYYPARAKSIIDDIDRVLGMHYGFTDEELDFIVNYDIKYRMGRDAADDAVAGDA